MSSKKMIDADVLIAKILLPCIFCFSTPSRLTADDADTRWPKFPVIFLSSTFLSSFSFVLFVFFVAKMFSRTLRN